MTDAKAEWSDTLVHLLALAARLEGEGQYNLAKLARATAEALTRQAAFKIVLPSEKDKLADEIEPAVAALSRLNVNEDLLAALRRGAAAMADGRLPLIDETPHPYVCRTCGHIVLNAPAGKCPVCGAWPSTFKRFLPVYWLDALEPFAALERLRQTPSDVAALLEGLSEKALSQTPENGGWSIRHVVSHLRDAQGVLSFRLNLFLEQENPALESKAVFEWATNEEERPATTQEIFNAYRASRQETIATLEGMPLRDWWRTGQHKEFGTVTLRQQVSYFASHEITHLPQIEHLRNHLKTSEQLYQEVALSDYAHPESLVTTQWLAGHLGDPDIRPVEVAWAGSSYGSEYASGHVPGAVFWDYYRDLQHPIRRDLLERGMLEALFSRSGITHETTVVLYSNHHNLLSAYAFWLLKLYRHRDVRLLDGGREKWIEEGRPMTAEPPAIPPTRYTAPPPDWSIRASRDVVAEYIGQSNHLLVDLRPVEMYMGPDTGHTERAGHIPGAINVPSLMERDAGDSVASLRVPTLRRDGTFLAGAELRTLFESKGITPDKEIIVYCQRAGLSTHAWFVLAQLLGYPRVREYDGSWAEWGNLVGAPIEK